MEILKAILGKRLEDWSVQNLDLMHACTLHFNLCSVAGAWRFAVQWKKSSHKRTIYVSGITVLALINACFIRACVLHKL